MLKREFEAIAGYTVSDADYKNIIEPMYLATTLDKQSFVACLDKKRFAQPTKKQALNRLKKMALAYVNYGGYEEWDALQDAFYDYAERFYHVSGGHNEWCYLKEDTGRNGGVLTIYGYLGRVGCLSEDIALYSKY